MRTRGLIAYFIGACLLRGADAAAIIGVVLAARPAGAGDATGLLAACITLPHLAGPIAAQLLDRARSKKLVLAAAGLVYGIALAGAILLLPASLVTAAVGFLLAGLAGPLLTGGLSSQLATIVGTDERARRRAQGMDAFTYGISATAGPAVIAVVASTSSPAVAVLMAAAAAAVGAIVVLLLPGAADHSDGGDATAPVRLRSALRMLVQMPGLRRTTIATAVTAIPLGAVPLLAVGTVDSLNATAASSALLTSAYGAGNLAVSLLLIVVPLRGQADRLIRWGVVAVAIGFVLGLVIFSVPIGAAAFALLGVAMGVLFTASLAARAAFSPPGAEAQIFVSMAGIKVAFSSIGTAVAGTLLGLGGHMMFTMAALLTLATLAYLLIDRAPQASQ